MPRATRILLIAGDEGFRRDMASRLTQEGVQVTPVATGAEARAAALTDFDLILLDLELPDDDGLEVLRHLRAGRPANEALNPPVLLLKGEGEPSHILQRGFDFGASGYVIKHRLPRGANATKITDHLVKAASATGSRRDFCPFSSRHDFARCSVFLPLSIGNGNGDGGDGGEPLLTCSHLRIGTADTWRLYPRCAIGDQARRDRYLEDRAPV